MKQSHIFDFFKQIDKTDSKTPETRVMNEANINPASKKILKDISSNNQNFIKSSRQQNLKRNGRPLEEIIPKKEARIDKTPSINESDKENRLSSLSDFDLNDSWCTDDQWDSVIRVVISAIEMINNDVKRLIGNRDHGSMTKGESMIIDLMGLWSDTIVEPGDTCNIIDPRVISESGTSHCIVSNESGSIIVHPDSLLSVTSVSGSLFCQRRAVLQHFFSNISPPLAEPVSSKSRMAIGSLVHALFQKCSLLRNISDRSVIEKVAMDCVEQQKQLLALYEAGLTDCDVKEQLNEYYDPIRNWLKKNIFTGIETNGPAKHVIDIEENIWSAKYGMKGKIDVTLQLPNSQKTIMPLELKTGKPWLSREHSSQVIMYLLMMGEQRNINIEQGLLLYLKNGYEYFVLNENRPSFMSIINLRNEFSYFLHKVKKSSVTEPNYLPAVINNNNLCQKCDYRSLCTMFSRLSQEENSCTTSKKDFIMKHTDHLNDKDFNFFIHWINLILKEYFSESECESVIKNIVLQTSTKSIRCIKLISSSYNGKDYVLLFNIPQIPHKFVEGDPIIISSNDGKRVALGLGFVSESGGENNISVISEKPLICSQTEMLRLDLNYSLKLSVLNLSVLSDVMNPSSVSRYLRKFIVHDEPPSFDLELSEHLCERIECIMKACNDNQRQAIIKVLSAKNYVLIKGYPGSGKTFCIVSLIRIFVILGMKVLVSSYTHSAVSNILLKLDQNEMEYVYLSGKRNVCDELSSRTFDSLIQTNNVKSINSLKKMIEKIDVFGVTCLSANHQVLSEVTFDVIIIDEAGQTTLPATIMPLLKLKPENGKFILIGDLHQLSPLVKNSIARLEGLDESLFALLCKLNHPDSIYELTFQYRMNREILKLCNSITYGNRISCASESIEEATIPILNISSIPTLEFWMQRCLSSELKNSVVFLNHHEDKNSDENSYSNDYEAKIVKNLVQLFVELTIPGSDIGVIVPYNQQKDKLNSLFCLNVEINTIDQYQGRDKSIIIISFVRQKRNLRCVVENESTDILSNRQRLNVALTRAKHKLIMIGDLKSLSDVYKPMKELKDSLSFQQIVDL